MKRIVSGFMLICLFLFLNVPTHAANFSPKVTTDPEKSWTITFNDEVNFDLQNRNMIYIASDNDSKHPVSLSLSDDSKKITVHPTKPYLFGASYTLVIPKEFKSKNGASLKSAVDMPFKLQGTYIQSISATLNPFMTNVKVQGTSSVASMTVSVNGTAEQTLHPSSNHQFQRGMLGLTSGDQLVIRAFDRQGILLEQQIYEVTN